MKTRVLFLVTVLLFMSCVTKTDMKDAGNGTNDARFTETADHIKEESNFLSVLPEDKEPADVMSKQAEMTLAWERPLYHMIIEKGYLQSEEDYYTGSNEYGVEAEPVSFALRDLNTPSDGIPELSVFNGSTVYFDSMNHIYSYNNGGFHYISSIKSCYYDGHRITGDAAFPGIFDEGAHTGGYWTTYCYMDQNGAYQVEEVLTGDATGDVLKEGWRTDNDALYAAYQKIGGWDWGDENGRPNELKYFTLEEINSMGWEAFLKAYGYTSFLFTEYSSGFDPADDSAKTEDAEEAVHEVAADSLPEKLPEFLSAFGWYSDYDGYDCENPKEIDNFYAFFFGNEYLSLENVYPGLIDIDMGFDYRIMDAEGTDRVLKNIYNWDDEMIDALKKEGVSEWFRYADGKYHGRMAGVGGGYEAVIKTALFDGTYYYIEYDLLMENMPYGMVSQGIHYAEMEFKQIDGRGYWSIYRDNLQPFGKFLEKEEENATTVAGTGGYDIVEEIAIDKELQRDLNVFLCNFTETNDAEIGIGFYQFDGDNYDVTQLMDFAFLWTNSNQHQNMKTYPDRDFLHYGITLQQINYAIERYFGFTITEQQARGYANTDEYRYYRDSVLHWRWGSGSIFTEAAIVDRAARLKDGTLYLEFTGYLIYWGEEKEYYPLTPSQAASRNAADQYLWEKRYHGTAIAKPYEENGKTRYKLLKYTTDQQ